MLKSKSVNTGSFDESMEINKLLLGVKNPQLLEGCLESISITLFFDSAILLLASHPKNVFAFM